MSDVFMSNFILDSCDVEKDRRAMLTRLDAIKDVVPQVGPTPLEYEDAQPPWCGCDRGLPEVNKSELSIDVLRSAMAFKGGLIVRNFLPQDTCDHYCHAIDGMQEESSEKDERYQNIADNLEGLFSEAELAHSRGMHRISGSIMAMESSSVAQHLLSTYEALGVKELLRSYLGDEPCLSVKKWVLRKSKLPVNPNGWHQDGSFMGKGINSINLWIPLTACGGDTQAPGLDVVPYRFKEVVPTGVDGAIFDWSVGSHSPALNIPGHLPISPEFAAGDALFFDHFSLHRTQYKAEFSKLRYAIETWFFSSSNFPKNQIPVAW